MKHLSKFKLVAVAQNHVQSKTDHRRVKLIEKLDDQLAMAEALAMMMIFFNFVILAGNVRLLCLTY